MAYSFKRTELYELIWSEPIRTIAQRVGISDVALKKLCRRHGIPVPPRGHWAKASAGKRTYQPELPRRGLGMPEEITSKEDRWRPLDSENPEGIAIPPAPEFGEPMANVVARVQGMVGKVVVPKSLDRPHPLIAKVLAADEVRREKQRAASYSIWDAPLFDSPFEKRRLRILNALIIALERCDARPWLNGKEALEAGARVGEYPVGCRLDDPKQPADRYRPRSDSSRPALDKLELRITHPLYDDGFPRSWSDEPGALIESRLSEVVATLLVVAESAHRLRAIHQHEWLTERKADLIEEKRKRIELARRKEQERLEKARQARVNRLLGEASALRHANDIRDYIAEVRRTGSASGDQIDAWAAWAHGVADSIDPVLSGMYLLSVDESSDATGDAEPACS